MLAKRFISSNSLTSICRIDSCKYTSLLLSSSGQDQIKTSRPALPPKFRLNRPRSNIRCKMSINSIPKKKVCIVGSGSWGSAISKIIGKNVLNSDTFQNEISMYIYEEMVNGEKLSEIINQKRENPKYLPCHKVPNNLTAIPDAREAAKGADVLIFVVPHQFIPSICNELKGVIHSDAVGISLIKGISDSSSDFDQISDYIHSSLNIPVSVLMGANLAPEVADGKFCEATIGCKDVEHHSMWKDLFHCNYFKINIIKDAAAVELCGALKNIVALGVGFVEGLGYGDNTKAAIIRLGLLEMRLFAELFLEDVEPATFLESCGLGDLITTCYGGRNRKLAIEFVKSNKSFEVLEKELLNGQKLQGPHTALVAYRQLEKIGHTESCPILSSVYKICFENAKPSTLITNLEESL